MLCPWKWWPLHVRPRALLRNELTTMIGKKSIVSARKRQAKVRWGTVWHHNVTAWSTSIVFQQILQQLAIGNPKFNPPPKKNSQENGKIQRPKQTMDLSEFECPKCFTKCCNKIWQYAQLGSKFCGSHSAVLRNDWGQLLDHSKEWLGGSYLTTRPFLGVAEWLAPSHS